MHWMVILEYILLLISQSHPSSIEHTVTNDLMAYTVSANDVIIGKDHNFNGRCECVTQETWSQKDFKQKITQHLVVMYKYMEFIDGKSTLKNAIIKENLNVIGNATFSNLKVEGW